MVQLPTKYQVTVGKGEADRHWEVNKNHYFQRLSLFTTKNVLYESEECCIHK